MGGYTLSSGCNPEASCAGLRDDADDTIGRRSPTSVEGELPMKAPTVLIAALIAFDVALAVAISLDWVAPAFAMVLLSVNPILLIAAYRLRHGRRSA
jgi:hypothetical protein